MNTTPDPTTDELRGEGRDESPDFALLPDLTQYAYRKLILISTATGARHVFEVKPWEMRGSERYPARKTRVLIWCKAEPLRVGEVKDDGTVQLWRNAPEHPPAGVIKSLENPVWAFERGVRFEVEQVCRVCARQLTDAPSIDLGIGPTCGGLSHTRLAGVERRLKGDVSGDAARVGEVRAALAEGWRDVAGALARRVTHPDLRGAALRLILR